MTKLDLEECVVDRFSNLFNPFPVQALASSSRVINCMIPPRLFRVHRPLSMEEHLYHSLQLSTWFRRLLAGLSTYMPSGCLQFRKVVTPGIGMQPRLSCGALDLTCAISYWFAWVFKTDAANSKQGPCKIFDSLSSTFWCLYIL